MSSVVAVAGGTGGLGHAIVDALVESGKFTVLVLSREANESKSKELGAKILATDYNDVDSIVRTLEENKVDTVVSVLGGRTGGAPELALIIAADKSSVTKRYIPSWWGLKYTPEVSKIFPLAEPRIAVLNAIEATSLDYTVVINGLFLDYWVMPHVKSYLQGFTLLVDMANKAAAIPGSGNVPVTLTYSFDIAKLTTALLTQSFWEKETYIIGDKITFNEFLAIAEEARGDKFDVSYDSVEMLQKGQATELPGHKQAYSFLPKEQVQGMSATFGILFDSGFLDFKPEKTLNEQFPEIKTRTVKELVEEAWKGK